MASATPEEGNLSMKHFRRCSMVLVLVVMPGAALSQASAPTAQEESPAVASHVQRAQEIAGSEWRFLSDGFLCGRAENTIPLAIRTIPGFLVPDAPAIEPFAAFDNLYYVGMYAWGTFILDTGEGLILFDALTNERQVQEILLPGMAELGLDPEDLKYLVVTHGHVDHYGGAPYLKQEYGVPILMSEADWEYLPHEISLPYFVRANYPPVVQPERDQVVQDGEVLKLGNASVTFVITPGHTPGTLSTILTVKDRGEPRTVAMWGGQALPGDVRQLNQMHGSPAPVLEPGQGTGRGGAHQHAPLGGRQFRASRKRNRRRQQSAADRAGWIRARHGHIRRVHQGPVCPVPHEGAVKARVGQKGASVNPVRCG